MSNKKNKEDIVKITLRATKGEKTILESKASQANKSINRFLIDTALHSQPSHKSDAAFLAQYLIQVLRMIDNIEDQAIQKKLREECIQVWHGLGSLIRMENTTTTNL